MSGDAAVAALLERHKLLESQMDSCHRDRVQRIESLRASVSRYQACQKALIEVHTALKLLLPSSVEDLNDPSIWNWEEPTLLPGEDR